MSPEKQDFSTQLQSIVIDVIDTQHNVLDRYISFSMVLRVLQADSGPEDCQTCTRQAPSTALRAGEGKYESRLLLPSLPTLAP